MSRVEEMAALANDLARSFDQRTSGLEELRRGVTAHRQAVRDERRATREAQEELAMQLRRRLTSDHQGLAREVLETREEFRTAQDELGQSLRAHLHEDRLQRGDQVAASLRAFRWARSQTALEQQERLRGGCRALRDETGAVMLGTHRQRMEDTARLAEELSRESANRREEVPRWLAEVRANRLVGAQEQVSGLSQHHAKAQAETGRSLAGFHAARRALGANLREMSQRWQEFSVIMRDKRASPTQPVIEGTNALAAMKPVGPGPKVESHLAAEVIQTITTSPQGVKLVDLESQYRISRIEMAQLLRGLMEEGKIRKEDKLYVAVTTPNEAPDVSGGVPAWVPAG